MKCLLDPSCWLARAHLAASSRGEGGNRGAGWLSAHDRVHRVVGSGGTCPRCRPLTCDGTRCGDVARLTNLSVSAAMVSCQITAAPAGLETLEI